MTTIKTIRLGDFYCILAELYCGDMEGNEWTELHYIAVERKTGKNLIYYSEELNGDVRLFTTLKDAEDYLEMHDYFHSNCKRAWVCNFDDAVESAIATLKEQLKEEEE